MNDHVYRVRPVVGGYVPEMLMQPEYWAPLRPNGYWAQPKCYSTQNPTVYVPMTEPEALAAIEAAKAINGDGGSGG